MAAPDLLGEDIVQKDKRLAYVVCGLICLIGAMLSGCRSSASPLAEATSHAKRLYARAAVLLNDTTYKVDDDFAPLATMKGDAPEAIPEPSPTEPSDLVEITPAGHINPKADAAIKEAIDTLVEAMKSAEGQPEFDQLQAQAVLAKLYSLRGFRNSMEAARNADAAWASALKAESTVVKMSSLGKRIATCDQMLSVKDESLGQYADAAKSERSAMADKIAKAKGEISKLNKEKTDLTADSTKLTKEADELHVRSRLAEPIESVDIFDQAKTLEDKVGKNTARITEIDGAIAILESRIAEYEGTMAAADRQMSVAGEMAKVRGERRTEVENQRQGFVAELTKAQKQAEMLAGEVIMAAKAAATNEAKAAADYEQAIKTYEQYQVASKNFSEQFSSDEFLKQDPGILAMFGDTRMARGNLLVQSLLLQGRLAAVVKHANDIWTALPTQNTPPAIISQMDDYVVDVAKTRGDAQADFRWAAKAYVTATNSQKDKKAKWSYQLQQAAAYVSFYRISADANARQKALDSLDALGEQEGSPLIAPKAASLRKLIDDGPVTDIGGPATSTP